MNKILKNLRSYLIGKKALLKRTQVLEEKNKVLEQEIKIVKNEKEEVETKLRSRDRFMESYRFEMPDGIITVMEQNAINPFDFANSMKEYAKFLQWGIDWVVTRKRLGQEFFEMKNKDEALSHGGDAFTEFLKLFFKEFNSTDRKITRKPIKRKK